MDTAQRGAIVDLSGGAAAQPADVDSPAAVVRALYDVISGPAEAERSRDWDRLRSLFLPRARLTIVRWGMEGGGDEQVLREWDVESFVETARAFWGTTGFFERELHHRADVFGHIAQVFSTYVSWVGADGGEPAGRGINSVQLVRAEDRWWIANLVWDVERPDNPIPDGYLPEAPG